jgi:anti-anti-sigma factor
MSSAAATLALGPELTIAFAAAWHETLADALARCEGDLQLDLGAVSEFDSSGVQLLLSVKRSLAERGAALQVVAVSDAVREALQVFGLHTVFGLAAESA